MLDHSVIGDVVGCVKADASEDTQEITSMGGCLMWNNVTVYGGRVRLKVLLGSGLICGNPLRGIPIRYFMFL